MNRVERNTPLPLMLAPSNVASSENLARVKSTELKLTPSNFAGPAKARCRKSAFCWNVALVNAGQATERRRGRRKSVELGPPGEGGRIEPGVAGNRGVCE